MKKFVVFFVVFLFIFNLYNIENTAIADGEDERDIVDYVLLLDCTSFAADSDKEDMRIAAAKLFVDLLPIDNARISILTIREKMNPDESYVLKADDLIAGTHITERFQCIKEVVPLQEAPTLNDRKQIKRLIEEAYIIPENYTYSDIHSGLYAVMDLLKAANSKNACIIAITNGRAADYKGYHIQDANGDIVEAQDTLYDKVEETAINQTEYREKWPIYYIDVSFDGQNRSGLDVSERLETITQNSGGETLEVEQPEQLVKTFGDLLARYIRRKAEVIEIHADNEGNAIYEFEMMDIVSEMNMVFTGDEVRSISITDPSGVVVEFEENTTNNDDHMRFSLEKGGDNDSFKYAALKLIRPTMGSWKLSVKTGSGNKIYLQSISAQEVQLSMRATPMPGEEMYKKTKPLALEAYFEYAGEIVASDKFYKENPAQLLVLNTTTGQSDSYIVKSKEDGTGYFTDFKVDKSGGYEFKFRIESNIFRLGYKESETFTYYFSNNSPETINSMNDITMHIGEQSEKIDIMSLFQDKDDDKLECKMMCEDDRTVEVNCSLDAYGYLTFKAPDASGIYNMQLQAYDNDTTSENYVYHEFVLTLLNQPPNIDNKIEDVKLIINKPKFIKGESDNFEHGLNNVFSDLENYPMSFSYEYLDKNNQPLETEELEDVEKSIYTEIVGQNLSIQAKKSGKYFVGVTAIDNNELTNTTYFKVSITNWYRDMFNQYWYILLILGLLIAVIILLMNARRVKGSLNISIYNEGREISSEYMESLTSLRKAAFKRPKVKVYDVAKYVLRDKPDNIKLFRTKAIFKGTLFGAPSILSDREWKMYIEPSDDSEDKKYKKKIKLSKDTVCLVNGNRIIKIKYQY